MKDEMDQVFIRVVIVLGASGIAAILLSIFAGAGGGQ